MYQACPECRVIYGRENGYFTGAMLISYALAAALLGLLALVVALVTGSRAELVILTACLYALPFAPALSSATRA